MRAIFSTPRACNSYTARMLWEWLSGGSCSSVEIQGEKLILNLAPDHDSRLSGDHGGQTFEDFRIYGPSWTTVPADILAQLTAQHGRENPPWLDPAYGP